MRVGMNKQRTRTDLLKEILRNENIQTELEMDFFSELPFSFPEIRWIKSELYLYTKKMNYDNLKFSVQKVIKELLRYQNEEHYKERCLVLDKLLTLEGIQDRKRMHISGIHFPCNNTEHKWVIKEWEDYIESFQKEEIKKQQIQLIQELLHYKSR